MESLEAEGRKVPVSQQDDICLSVYICHVRTWNLNYQVVICFERFVTFFVNYCIVYLLLLEGL